VNKNSIKGSMIAILLFGILLVSPILSSLEIQESVNSVTALGPGRALLMGTIVQPEKEDGIWTAQALQVFYYKPGVLFNQGGTVKRLTTITFEEGPFLQVWTPGPFEFIGYVFGITPGFEIIED
jgi:hypothetical protein